MKRLFMYVIVLSFTLSSINSVLAQVDMEKVGQSTMNFLQVSVIPAASAMGEAYTAIGTGCESIFYNPAGLPEMDAKYAVLVTNTMYVADINYYAGAVAWNTGTWGTIGVSFITVDYGDIIWTSLAVDPGDELGYEEHGYVSNVGAYAFGLSYGRRISDKFSVGGDVRYVGQQLGESFLETGKKKNSESQVAFDLGVKFYPGFKSFRFAMSIRNFGPSVKYEEITAQLPLMFGVGVAMDMMDLFDTSQSNDDNLLLSAEFIHPNNYTERINVGLEYKFMNLLALRCGYQSNTDLAGFSAGIGITPPEVGGVKLDISYTYSDLDLFDGINRFSIKVEL